MAKNKQVMRVKGGSAVQQDKLVQFTFDGKSYICLLYTSPSPRDATLSRMPSSA